MGLEWETPKDLFRMIKAKDLERAEKVKIEIFLCRYCGNKNDKAKFYGGILKWVGREAGLEVCSRCLKDLLTCQHCQTTKPLQDWDPTKSHTGQCLECSPGEIKLSIKQANFIPTSRLLSLRRRGLWPMSSI